jgi:hypothetical protein
MRRGGLTFKVRVSIFGTLIPIWRASLPQPTLALVNLERHSYIKSPETLSRSRVLNIAGLPGITNSNILCTTHLRSHVPIIYPSAWNTLNFQSPPHLYRGMVSEAVNIILDALEVSQKLGQLSTTCSTQECLPAFSAPSLYIYTTTPFD